MILDITNLKNGYQKAIDFNQTCSFAKELLEKTELIALENVQIKGSICLYYETYHIEATLTGVMLLPCSITLEEVKYPFSVEIDEDLEEEIQKDKKNTKKCENSIDILPIIWENILMEIPMKVVSEKAKNIHLEGDGWRLMTDGEEVKNSPFEKLNDLLK